MKISSILKNKRTLSFEVFPPKKDGEGSEKLYKTIDRLKTLSPDFISVTYGASGSNARNSAEIAGYIKSIGIEPLAHLTGGPSTPDDIDRVAQTLISFNVENVLALRGDRPVDFPLDYCKYFKHATDLELYLKKYNFCLGGACYPEGHSESQSLYADLENLKKKEQCGAQFFISQIFYDNSYYYRLVNEARKAGIKSPVIAGIMPITNVKNLKSIKSMCGSTIPIELRNTIEVYSENPAVLREAGLNYAAWQITDLIAKGAQGIHLYVMNNADTAIEIYNRLEKVLNEFFRT